jgi:hypothetical protein
MRFFERLNTARALAIVLVLVLIVDGFLFYTHNLEFQSEGSDASPLSTFRIELDTPVEESTLSSREQANDAPWDSLPATSLLLIALLTGGVVINVVIALLTLLSVRRLSKAGRNHAGYLGEERQHLKGEEVHSSDSPPPQVHKLEQEVLNLQQEHKQLAEELVRVRALHQEAERERERILEGLQSIQHALLRKVGATPSEEEEDRSKGDL